MGKDNVPFHTVIFPSSLIGTGEEWTLVHNLSTTGNQLYFYYYNFFFRREKKKLDFC